MSDPFEDWGDWKEVLRDTDPATARAIVQAQLEDTTATASSYGGDKDAAVARHLFRKELRQLMFDLPSRETGEQLEEEDNALEEALEGAAFGWSLNEWENRVEPVPEPPRSIECTACTDRVRHTKIVTASCGDHYCDDCLENLYDKCMKDETLFPPRCHQKEFPWELVKHHLSQRCRSKFGQKRKELETKDRTYCHVASCSSFIDPATIPTYCWAPCPSCQRLTCSLCKKAAHYGQCTQDETLTELMATAQEEGWQRRYACRQMVELRHGCNHMTCVCKSEFCYVCAAPWKTCACAQWDEERLLEAAEDVVDLQDFVEEETPEQREARIIQTAEHLCIVHDCDHDVGFRGLREPGREYECAVCDTVYHTWIYQCRQCSMIACNFCRRHRL